MYVAGLSNLEGGLEQTDIVFGEDGWPWKRSELDRPISSVHANFINGLGPDGSPLQIGVDMASQTDRGDIDILEVGGGTGHTMRTLVDSIVLRTGFDRARIHGTVLDCNDFSEASLSAKTREAYAEGELEYLIGKAEGLPYELTPENGYDIVYAYESLIYLKRPQDLIPRLVRLAKPAGHIVFNALGTRAAQINTQLARAARNWDITHSVIELDSNIGNQTRAFYHLTKPAQTNQQT